MNCLIRAAWSELLPPRLLVRLLVRLLRLLGPNPVGLLDPPPVLTLALGNKADTACWIADEFVFSKVTIRTVRLASLAALSSVETKASTCLNRASLADTTRALVRLSTPIVIFTPPLLLPPRELLPRLPPPPPPINIANGLAPCELPRPLERLLEVSSSL